MQEVVKIVNTDLAIKSIDGKRVVSFSDIDKVHERGTETARFRFNSNKSHFIKNVDYFILKPADFLMCEKHTIEGITKKNVSNRGTTFLTESGYLMIVKSFTDDLAWKVQRDLVNSYFKLKEIAPASTEVLALKQDLKILYQQINEMEQTLDYQHEKFKDMCIYITINYKQQQELLTLARKRINFLLGGTKSVPYKEWSRIYFKNLWLNFGEYFECGTYRDLKPDDMERAKEYIKNWIYRH